MSILINYAATVTISPLQRNVSNTDIDCPGDIIPYNCSIRSNSEMVHLIWRVMLPEHMPINITYDSTSRLNNTDNLNDFISAIPRVYERGEYIESVLQLVLQDTISLNMTVTECIIEGLGIDSVTLIVNSSGIYR